VLVGRYARLERLRPEHAAALHVANLADDGIWDYLPYGPFADVDAYAAWVDAMAAQSDPVFYASREVGTGQLGGVASYLRINGAQGVIEVGHINYAPALQRSRAATEAMVLMMARAFEELGYRRYEWKCDALNAGSRAAAERLGMTFEGVFRQLTLYKGRNRDTAWYAVIDQDWPRLKAAFDTWLDPANFDARGQQKQRLSGLTRE